MAEMAPAKREDRRQKVIGKGAALPAAGDRQEFFRGIAIGRKNYPRPRSPDAQPVCVERFPDCLTTCSGICVAARRAKAGDNLWGRDAHHHQDVLWINCARREVAVRSAKDF